MESGPPGSDRPSDEQRPGPAPPAYGGPVPPGGWQAPLTAVAPGWHGAPLASWGSRVGAAVLDGLILLVPVVLLTFIVIAAFTGDDVAGWISIGVALLVYLLIALFYAPLTMSRGGRHNGQTWGKQALGITVVRNDGQRVGMGFAFLRELVVKYLLFWVVGSAILYIPTLLDYLWPLWDDENRCLHDMIVSTHVVRVG